MAIVGSRDCPPIDIASHMGEVPFIPEVIVSGGAKGADTFAREYAIRNNIRLLEFIPDYKKFGRIAPIIRNRQIVENCDFLLAFWNGKSPGTRHALDYAKRKGKPVSIVRIT